MRRAAPPVPVSPKLLKHFAAVTIGLTVCIALFADGESRDAIADKLAEREARNQLLQTEADKLGAKKFKSNLKVKAPAQGTIEMSDSGSSSPATSGGGAIAYSDSQDDPAASRMIGPPPQAIGPNSEGFETGPTVTSGNSHKARRPQRPSPEQIAKIREVSRLRSGAPEGSD